MNEGMIYDAQIFEQNVERKVDGSVLIKGNLRVYEDAVKKAKRP